MKHAARACWRFSLAVLVGLGFDLGMGGFAHAQPAQDGQAARDVHITSVELLQMPASAGPITGTVNAAALPGTWVPADLPYAYLGQLLPGTPAPKGAPKTAEPKSTDPKAAAPGSGAPQAPVAPAPPPAAGQDPAQKSATPPKGGTPVVTRWFRFTPAISAAPGETMALYLVRMQVVGQIAIYGDGKLLHRSRGSAAWNVFRHPALFLSLTQSADQPAPRELLIRVDSVGVSSGAISSLYVGEYKSVYARYSLREWYEYQIPFMASAAFAAVGLFSLAVWMFRRREPLYLLFFATALTTVIRRWHFYYALEVPLPDAWFLWLVLNAAFWQLVFLHYFLGLLHRRPLPWLGRGIIAVALACSILTLPQVFSGLAHYRQTIYILLIVVNVVVVVVGTYSSWRAHSREGLILAIGHVVFLAMGLVDWAKFNSGVINPEAVYLTPYVTFAQFALYSYVMFRRYINALKEVEQVNTSLNARLQAREAELAQSYQLLREVEHRETLSRERARLVQDMHDGLGSSLMSALRVVEHGRANEQAVAEVLKACIDDLNLTIDSMEPVEADLLLLLATLRYRLGPRLENSGIKLRWEIQDVPPLDWLEPRAALHILRILQEALTNIIKHTKADEITVFTASSADGVQVDVADNGGGFDVEGARKSGGKGLANQLRRAEAVGARLSWQTNAYGTRFSLWLPLRNGSLATDAPAPAGSV